MAGIKAGRVSALQPRHSPYQIRLWCLDEQMVMITHQNVGVNSPPVFATGFAQGSQKHLPIIIIVVNIFPTIPSCHHMIESIGVFDSDLSRHNEHSNKIPVILQEYSPDPFFIFHHFLSVGKVGFSYGALKFMLVISFVWVLCGRNCRLYYIMATWHYADKNKEQHQVEDSELKAVVESGGISPATPVWKNGMDGWKPAKEVLGDVFAATAGAASAPPSLSNAVASGQIKSHVIDHEIIGDDMQIVEIELDPGETVIAEAGAMNYLEEDISFEAKMGDGAKPDAGMMGALLAVGKRVLTGESIFLTHFTHQGSSGKRRVAFAAPYPGKIIALDLDDTGGEITCQKDAFLCAAKGTEVSIAFHKKLGAGFFGGEGFILQRLRGDGMAFIHAGGTVIERELDGETLRVDTGCLVAFSPGINYDIQRAGNMKSMFFGGEGMFLATLSGHGKVWLQSLPFSRMADRILAHAPSAGGKSKGEGSVLGGIGRLLDGN